MLKSAFLFSGVHTGDLFDRFAEGFPVVGVVDTPGALSPG